MGLSVFAFGLVLPTLAAAVGSGSVNGPVGQAGPNIVVDDRRPGTIYAPIPAGLAKSMDHGGTWTNLESTPASILYPVAASNGAVYIAVGEGDFSIFGVVTRIDRSLDGGLHWQSWAAPTAGSVTGTALAIDPGRPTTAYRFSAYLGLPRFDPLGGVGVGRSDDDGQTWKTINPPGAQSVTGFVIDPKQSTTLYLAGRGSLAAPSTLFKSSDSGDSWIPLTDSLGLVKAMAIDPVQTGTIYVASSDGLYRSLDAGSTYTLVSPGVQIQELVVDPVRTNRLFAITTSGALATTDNVTRPWDSIDTGSVQPKTIVIEPDGSFLHAASDDTILNLPIVNGSGELILNSAHSFTITLSATDQRTGRTGAGVATQVNDLWGYFSIPAITSNPNNPEVFVKLLDGTAINGRFWFFYGGLTDLEYTLTVTDDATGIQKTYTKPAGSECGGSDTAAFPP